jgi:hypothetical protein
MKILTISKDNGVSLHCREDRAGFTGLVIGREEDNQSEDDNDNDLQCNAGLEIAADMLLHRFSKWL